MHHHPPRLSLYLRAQNISPFLHNKAQSHRMLSHSPGRRCPCRRWRGFPPRCTSSTRGSPCSSPSRASIRAACRFSVGLPIEIHYLTPSCDIPRGVGVALGKSATPPAIEGGAL